MKISIVIGLGYGDEGKGLVTSYLSKNKDYNDPLVIRFNGGHQAGHTVVHNDITYIRHIFSNFGSGTLYNVPTFWSKYCTFYPVSVLNEYEVLKKHSIRPTLFVDPLCPVTTPFDVYVNRIEAKITNHGTVGVGFGQTLKRQEDYYKLFVQDLFYEQVLVEKLRNIKDYYHSQRSIRPWMPSDINSNTFWNNVIKNYIDSIKILIDKEILTKKELHVHQYDHLIFEGAQGVLLDMDHGFFPNVTRSNTTSKNAMSILNEWGLDDEVKNIFYVSRLYHTRHGRGFMPNEQYHVCLKNDENETNVKNEFQEKFRIAPLDIDLLNYAINTESNYSKNNCYKSLFFTCRDQVEDKITCVKNGELFHLNIDEIFSMLEYKFKHTYISSSDDGNKIANRIGYTSMNFVD